MHCRRRCMCASRTKQRVDESAEFGGQATARASDLLRSFLSGSCWQARSKVPSIGSIQIPLANPLFSLNYVHCCIEALLAPPSPTLPNTLALSNSDHWLRYSTAIGHDLTPYPLVGFSQTDRQPQSGPVPRVGSKRHSGWRR